jgi:hypothetical protein
MYCSPNYQKVKAFNIDDSRPFSEVFNEFVEANPTFDISRIECIDIQAGPGAQTLFLVYYLVAKPNEKETD